MDYRQIALDSILPAAGSRAKLLVATFPVSIVCGLLFLANYRGLTGELGYALLRRYRIWGWLAWSPRCMRLGFAPQTSDNSPCRGIGRILSFHELLLVCSVVNGLSFAFEYLLGTCLQVYLLLIAYGWVRGLHFRRARVLQFAVRRMGSFSSGHWLSFLRRSRSFICLSSRGMALEDPIGWRTLILWK